MKNQMVENIYNEAIELHRKKYSYNHIFVYNEWGGLLCAGKTEDYMKVKFLQNKRDNSQNTVIKVTSTDISSGAKYQANHVPYNKVVIQIKSIGVTFTIRNDDTQDLERLKYVVKVANHCDKDPYLMQFAKKKPPKMINFRRKHTHVSKEDYQYYLDNLHEVNEAIKIVNLIKA